MTSISHCATFAIASLIVSTLACGLGSSPSPTTLPTLAHAVTESVSTSAAAITPTSTPLSSTPTGTLMPALKDIQQIWMVDESNGWAADASNRLYRTSDGGQGWYPMPVPGGYSAHLSVFLDPAHIWLVEPNPSPALWRTTDGGITWAHLTDIGLPNTGGEPFYRFTSAEDGLVELSGFGVGNMYDRLFETHDGGASFQPIPIVGPSNKTGLADGIIQYCRLCGSALYYGTSRAVLVEGSLEKSPGAITVKQSTDLGQHWSESMLPLPAGYQNALIVALSLTFAGDGHGYLPIRLLHYNATGKEYDAIAIYTSSDGGATWSLSPTVLSDAEPFMLNFHNLDAEILCGGKLCVSHDFTQTWETLTPNVDFSWADTHYVMQMIFTTPLSGWILFWENGAYNLYRTTDGGATWTLLNP